MNKAVFLDRDGVINVGMGGPLKRDKYVKTWEEFEFNPNAIRALKLLSDSDFKTIIITNQSGIGRGFYTEDALKEIHINMLKMLSRYNIKIDSIKYCSHVDEDKCNCRKPKPGLILSAAKEFNINLNESWFVGDSTKDIAAANNADKGIKTIMVKPGYDGNDGEFEAKPDYTAEDILDAVVLRS